MKLLFIGGTGTISTAISRQLLLEGHELTLINRGRRNSTLFTNKPSNLCEIIGDINDYPFIASQLEGKLFDAVADFIAFTPQDLERDYRLFQGKTKQFIYISSASAYQKPLSDYRITEGTPLSNPYWEYSRNKIAGEEFLMEKYRQEQFPVTIIRPSHTYGDTSIPLGVHGPNGSWQVIKRIMEDKPVIVHGDGTSLWTLTHNTDFAAAFIGLLGNIHAIGEAVQITGDETLTWNQIYDCIGNALGKTVKKVHVSSDFLAACSDYDLEGSLIGDKANSVVFDNTKLKRLVPGFTATKRFDQGVRQTLSYILSHPEYQKEDPAFEHWCDNVIAVRENALQELLSLHTK